MNKKNKSDEKIIDSKNDDFFRLLDKISKGFGKDTISTLKKSFLGEIESLHTGSLLLDEIIGSADNPCGYPYGRIVEIFGEESSGKTTLAIHAVRECQKKGKIAIYMDLENALNVPYVKEIGIDEEKLLIISPSDGENAFEIMKELISSNVGLIVVDSVATLIPKSELEGEMNQSLGSHARLMSKGLKIINNELSKRGIETVIIFINQLRQKISTFGGGFGNPETTTGGYALKFIASLRIKLKRVGRIEKDNNYIGIETLSEVIKNKISAPYKKTRIELMFNGGIQKERELLEKAVEKNIIKKNAGWYIFENETINGKENVISYLSKNPDVFEKIKKLVMKSN